WIELPKLADRHGCTVEPFPVLYAGLLDAHGQLGPARFPRLWMAKNVARKAAMLRIPLNPPAFLPFNPRRFRCAVDGNRWRAVLGLRRFCVFGFVPERHRSARFAGARE